MPCNCIEILREKLATHHSVKTDQIDFELETAIDTKTFEMMAELPPLHYSYPLAKKRKKSYVVFSFCPFCGKRK